MRRPPRTFFAACCTCYTSLPLKVTVVQLSFHWLTVCVYVLFVVFFKKQACIRVHCSQASARERGQEGAGPGGRGGGECGDTNVPAEVCKPAWQPLLDLSTPCHKSYQIRQKTTSKSKKKKLSELKARRFPCKCSTV